MQWFFLAKNNICIHTVQNMKLISTQNVYEKTENETEEERF